MKQMKKIILLLLALTLVFAFAACDAADAPEPTQMPIPETPTDQTSADWNLDLTDVLEFPAPDDASENPVASAATDETPARNQVRPTATPGNNQVQPTEAPAPNNAANAPLNVEIMVNGVLLADASAYTADGEIWPTHVSLAPVAWALGAEVTGAGLDVAVEGLSGTIFS